MIPAFQKSLFLKMTTHGKICIAQAFIGQKCFEKKVKISIKNKFRDT